MWISYLSKTCHIFRSTPHVSQGSELVKVQFLYYIYQLLIYNEELMFLMSLLHPHKNQLKWYVCVCVLTNRANLLSTLKFHLAFSA